MPPSVCEDRQWFPCGISLEVNATCNIVAAWPVEAWVRFPHTAQIRVENVGKIPIREVLVIVPGGNPATGHRKTKDGI